MTNKKNNDITKKKITIIGYLQKSADAVYKTFCRFPITILLFVALAIITIYRIEMPYEKIKYVNKTLNRIIGVVVLGIPFSLSVNLLIKKFWGNNKVIYKIGCYILELILLFLYYIYLFPNTDMETVIRLVIITFAMTLAFLFIPYLFKKDNFEIYIIKIITRVVSTVFFTIMLAVGVMAVLFAIKALLYNNMDKKYFIYTWILAWFIFAPINFLHGFPRIRDVFSIKQYNKVLKVLLLYIVLPIISIYTVVLYIYFAKIIITQIWPKGIVSYLVLSYTAVGIASIFLISPLIKENKWVKIFTSIYTKAIFPLLIMMFVSIGIRISEFGFTENRYLILIIGIWATFAVIFININKNKNNIILPITLSVIAILTVCGPWNAFNISKMSQNQRFYNILIKYNMIQNEKVVNNNSEIVSSDKKEIVGILHYFDKSHKLSDLKYLPKDFKLSKTEEVFGFPDKIYNNRNIDYCNYNRYKKTPLIITGYDILFDNMIFGYSKRTNVSLEKEINSQYGNIKILIDNKGRMILLRDSNEIYSYDLLKTIKKLYEKYGTNTNDEKIRPEDLVLIDSNDKVKVMLVFNSINVSVNTNNKEFKINNIEFDMFLKIKGYSY